MKDFYSLASTRRSIRKFRDTPIPKEDIQYFVDCAVTAPSACNSQCWNFVAVTDKELIAKIADAVGEEAKRFYANETVDTSESFLESRAKAITFFKNAPLVFFVFLDKMEYYDNRVVKIFQEKGYDDRQMLDYFGNPDVLSVGAAIQNMLLAIHEKGYGAVWMNDPVIAQKQIKELLQIKSEQRLLSVIPVGIPAYTPREKPYKPLDEVFELR